MTTSVTETSRSVIDYAPLSSFSSVLSIVVVALFIMLLIQKELFRAESGARWKHAAQTLDAALVPLFIMSSTVFAFRVLTMLNRL
jgi:H+/Cl- antiporter ClcA